MIATWARLSAQRTEVIRTTGIKAVWGYIKMHGRFLSYLRIEFRSCVWYNKLSDL